MSREKRPERNSGLLHKEMRMSREDDFFGDFHESPDNTGTGQEGTSQPLIHEPTEPQPSPEAPARPTAPRAKPRAKKKAKTKPKAKKKVSKKTRKPAARKTKKKKPAAKRKKSRPKK